MNVHHPYDGVLSQHSLARKPFRASSLNNAICPTANSSKLLKLSYQWVATTTMTLLLDTADCD